MTERLTYLLTVALLGLLTGCNEDSLQPALRVIQPGQAQAEREVLQAAISSMTGTRVLLAEEVFVSASEITVGREPGSSPRPGMGLDRIVMPPHHFRLYLLEGRCVVVHVETQALVATDGLQCRPEETPVVTREP